MSSSSRPPKRKAAEAAESKMARIEVQNDPIDEVLRRSSDLVDDGIDLHAQVHPRLVHEQVAGWHEQMLAPVVVHRILRVDVERMMNHTAACRARLLSRRQALLEPGVTTSGLTLKRRTISTLTMWMTLRERKGTRVLVR